MTRRIIAIGGGGFLMERRPSLLDEYFVRATGARNPKVCFISTGSGDLEEWLAKYYKAFSRLGCRSSHLAFFRNPRRGSIPLTQIERGLLAQDAIYVGGGNTRSMLAVWRSSALSCLGFLPGSCSPHFDGEPRRRGDFRRLISSGNRR
jgi:dipeptidase E